jgi:hypothetical protein
MPVRAAVAAPPTPPPPPSRIPRERMSATWEAPDGTVIPLMDRSAGWWTIQGAVYLGLVPITITRDPNQRGGSTPRHIQAEERNIIWPMHVQGRTQVEYLDRWEYLGNLFAQSRRLSNRPGILTITQPNGRTRQIEALYESGYDGLPELGWRNNQAVLSLLCPSPWWTDTVDTDVPRIDDPDALVPFLGSGGSGFFGISNVNTIGDSVVTVPGDDVVWPVWKITGPMSGFTATRTDADGSTEAFTLNPVGGPLAGGDVVTVATDPPLTTGPDGSAWPGAVPIGSVLWSLRPGDNAVSIVMADSGTGSRVDLIYRNRWQMP